MRRTGDLVTCAGQAGVVCSSQAMSALRSQYSSFWGFSPHLFATLWLEGVLYICPILSVV